MSRAEKKFCAILSDRVKNASPSATVAITEVARRLAAEGRTIISLSVGELDFDTPAHIQHAAIRGMNEGHTRYTNVGGTPSLKAAIARKFTRDNALGYKPAEIIAATGAKQILFNALLATLNPGDEVIVVAPYWVSYSEMVKIAGGVPVQVTPEEATQFKLTPSLLAAAVTPSSRWLILNAPCNPSGVLYTADELRALADVVCRHPAMMVMADDIYEEIVFEGEFVSFAQAAPDMRDRTLTINGVSKTYAMTGWRLGYAGGPEWLIKAMALLQSQSTSNPSSISQVAAQAALDGPQDFLDDWRARLRVRRDLALRILRRAAPVLRVPEAPQGAFYLYVNCAGAIGMKTPAGEIIANDEDMTRYLLERVGVAVVPGTAFGLAPYLRVSYALADDRLERACELIVEACTALVRD
ncbi:pyridoxal phosphate-dependent aminotransferase [Brenneria goodwinii]|uniref:pyridoxal phosphate-dependent aminotransferase n=1 Tax=Brenneria goodwinii TaxID=1109412 RepID=UPI000F1F8D17|nr:pyridoxal phosphate-dependent aminotransferase [Brenneria goodwinii]RLM22522.1 aspartate aminotransferase [Brenneria goodwinii]